MSKKGTKETGLSVAGQFTQSDIPKLLDGIQEKINQLKGDKEKAARITGELPLFGKISNIKDIDTLRAAYAYITKKTEAIESFNDAFKAVAPTAELSSYKEGGATVKQWQEEILTQYREVTFAEQLDKLEKAKQILQNNLSEELKLAASLQDVADLLKLA